MRSIKHVVIAAAGTGSRMQKNLPKCLIDFHGKPLIHHLLDNLAEFEDVRIVVGFTADLVIEAVRKIRNDVIFVLNNSYNSTTTLDSYLLGSRYLKCGVLYMDADIFFQPKSFLQFIDHAELTLDSPLIGITDAKTEDCVYAEVTQDSKIVSFSRSEKQLWEWANLAYLPPNYLKNNEQMAVYNALEPLLPLPAFVIDSFEVDTPSDLKNALRSVKSSTAVNI